MNSFVTGFLIDFISIPVTSGFTSAAAITIASSQIKNLLGLSGQSKGFLGSWIDLMKNIRNVQLWDTVLGSATIIVLLSLRVIVYFQLGYNIVLTLTYSSLEKIIIIINACHKQHALSYDCKIQ